MSMDEFLCIFLEVSQSFHFYIFLTDIYIYIYTWSTTKETRNILKDFK